MPDDSPSTPPAIMLNYAYWQRPFGGALGRWPHVVRLNNISTVIVGVAGPMRGLLRPATPSISLCRFRSLIESDPSIGATAIVYPTLASGGRS